MCFQVKAGSHPYSRHSETQVYGQTIFNAHTVQSTALVLIVGTNNTSGDPATMELTDLRA